MLSLADYDFPLPDSLIARTPAVPRDSSRLLHVPLKGGAAEHLQFHDIGKLLRVGDTLVVNTTRVLKARLFGKNAKGREFEVLLLEPNARDGWNALVRPGKHIDPNGSELTFPGGQTAQVIRRAEDARQFEVHFANKGEAFFAWLDAHGKMPLPPYLKRPATDRDAVDYQTVYAETGQSVAAPTAGLHFTPELLAEIQSRGIHIEKITLQVGYGTFAPLEPDAQELHAENFEIPTEVAERLAQTRRTGGRVIAVGTTSLRALEAAQGKPGPGTTRLFIRPGYKFTQLDGLITNFHLPQSSLFILVCAFLGRERAQAAYREAVLRQYRFFSYGDAMAIL
ncbi:tRNA preQ1(34) S-adenosylmethionine ribosyltransferase-isomerase QueA [bacterium]|nr:tRNA preQ1(34) S-adenosylmethionine ribosyltransferase-isomerase QueA [bacterium]